MAEIGIFVKAIHKAEKRKHITSVSEIYLGTNLTKKGYDEFIKSFNSIPKKDTLSQKDVDNEWRKLHNFMQGLS